MCRKVMVGATQSPEKRTIFKFLVRFAENKIIFLGHEKHSQNPNVWGKGIINCEMRAKLAYLLETVLEDTSSVR